MELKKTQEHTKNRTTVYVDGEDDITNILHKIKQSPTKVVALVLPKRTQTLQSLVAVRLLKRTSEKAAKQIVFVTTDKAQLSVAAQAGVYTAKSLSSKPELTTKIDNLVEDEVSTIDYADANKSVSLDQDIASNDSQKEEYANVQKPTEQSIDNNDPDTNSSEDNSVVALERDDVSKDNKTTQSETHNKIEKKQKISVPNFNRFRKRVILACSLLALLVGGWVVAFMILPTATIVIKTNSQSVRLEAKDVTISSSLSVSSPKDKQLKADVVSVKKTDTRKVTATGKKDVGTKATGQITLTNCTSSAVTIPSGTGVSSGSLTFITQEDVALSDGNFTGGGVCKTSGTHVGAVDVVAQNNGDSYNLGARSYAIAGVTGDVRAYGGAMSGGSSNVLTVLAQTDVDAAVQTLLDGFQQSTKTELQNKVNAVNSILLTDSFVQSTPVITTSSPVDAETSGEVTVVVEVTYSAFGVKSADIEASLQNVADQSVTNNNKKITSLGTDKASVAVTSKKSEKEYIVTISSTATTGAELDETVLKEQILGKKRNEIVSLIGQYPGVSDVTVTYKPFYVFSTPKSADKVTIQIEKPSLTPSTTTP